MRGTHCSEINKERLFYSDFAICEWNMLFRNWSLGTSFGLYCSDFISANGTFCSKSGISDFFVPWSHLRMEHNVPKFIGQD